MKKIHPKLLKLDLLSFRSSKQRFVPKLSVLIYRTHNLRFVRVRFGMSRSFYWRRTEPWQIGVLEPKFVSLNGG